MSNHKSTTKITAAAAVTIAPLFAFAGTASAGPGEWINPGIVPAYSAEAAVSCVNGTVDVTIGNKSGSHSFIDIFVDGDLFASPKVNAGTAHIAEIPVDENQAIAIEVVAGDSEILDEAVTLDCRHAAPDYHLTEDCDSGLAYAVLTNSGDDSAMMRVQYPDVMGMSIPVGAGATEHWLLAVDPGETTEFDVIADGAVLGHEVVSFDCGSPAPVAPAPVAPAPQATTPPAPAPSTTPDLPVSTTEQGALGEDEQLGQTDYEQALAATAGDQSTGGPGKKFVAVGLGLLGLTAGVAAIGETLHRRNVEGQPV